ncbi:MAG: DUF1552 domain-containing protein [Planctomycetota bacterium]|nr:DUF1552 domain-containing protein [Planctomycetota bacterium]
MNRAFNQLDRRRFLRGSGIALALPLLPSLSFATTRQQEESNSPKRLACFYFPDGVPMPLPQEDDYKDWFWFPLGTGKDYQFTKCLEPLSPLRENITVLSGFSHEASRSVHGHSNADQFLTSAATGYDGPYQNSISMDQVYADHIGSETRFSSLVMSTDGGVGTPRGAHTLSFNKNGKAIPAEHRPKAIFDQLFVKKDGNAAKRIALSKSSLDGLLEDANSLRKVLSENDRRSLDDYLDSVREAEIRVEKAKKWMHIPLPKVDQDQFNLNITPDDPKIYLQTMFDLVFLAFQTDSTRVATYQIGRENGVGISDHLARAVGFPLAHQLSHETRHPDGWKNFGKYCRFLNQEFSRFLGKLSHEKEPGGQGSMLDNSLVVYGSASSAFHLSRNYPLVLAGGKNMGFQHGIYVNHAGDNPQAGAWDGRTEPWQKDVQKQDRRLSDLYLTMLKQLGVQRDTFGDSRGIVKEILA